VPSTTTDCVAGTIESSTCATGSVPESRVSKAGSRDRETVNPDGRLGQFKLAGGIGDGAQGEGGIGSLKHDLGARERPVPGIVDNPHARWQRH
jgi:hypothetical protein